MCLTSLRCAWSLGPEQEEEVGQSWIQSVRPSSAALCDLLAVRFAHFFLFFDLFWFYTDPSGEMGSCGISFF